MYGGRTDTKLCGCRYKVTKKQTENSNGKFKSKAKTRFVINCSSHFVLVARRKLIFNFFFFFFFYPFCIVVSFRYTSAKNFSPLQTNKQTKIGYSFALKHTILCGFFHLKIKLQKASEAEETKANRIFELKIFLKRLWTNSVWETVERHFISE